MNTQFVLYHFMFFTSYIRRHFLDVLADFSHVLNCKIVCRLRWLRRAYVIASAPGCFSNLCNFFISRTSLKNTMEAASIFRNTYDCSVVLVCVKYQLGSK